MHPVPSDAEAARRAGFGTAGFSATGFAAPGASADAPNAAPAEEPGEPSTSHEVAVREQEPVALLEETRQTFTIIREKFSLRSRK